MMLGCCGCVSVVCLPEMYLGAQGGFIVELEDNVSLLGMAQLDHKNLFGDEHSIEHSFKSEP